MLQGTRVLCFTQFLLGPVAAQYLADMGAEVIKVERPQGAWERWWAGGDTFREGESVFFMLAHRNVRSVAGVQGLSVATPDPSHHALRAFGTTGVVIGEPVAIRIEQV